jgi:hypothetical protein
MKKVLFFLGLLCLPHSVQAQFSFTTNNGTIIITGFNSYGGAVVIPSTITGLPVVDIQGPGFEDKGITSVSIPDTVTNIESQEFAPNPTLTNFIVASNNPAFSGVGGVLFSSNGTTLAEYPPGLSGSYAIPGNVTSVADNAFAACYSLSGVTIPPGVTNLGATSFGYCFSLTNITIPSGVTSIGPDTFINCSNLVAINVAATNPAFASVAGVLFDKSQTTLLEFPTALGGSYIIPNGCVTIGTDAFILCDTLTNITMSANVTTLDDGAFADCAGLTRITLGAGVSSISSTAFGGDTALIAINMNSTNANFSSLNGVLFNKTQTTLIEYPPAVAGSYTVSATVTAIAPSAFADSAVQNVIIPGNVATIGLLAFQGCGSLTNVTMSNGVSSLGVVTFANCPNLATVTIPASVTNLPENLFAYCGLVSVFFEGNAPASDPSAFFGDTPVIYYLAGTSGWGASFDGFTTVAQDEPNPNGALAVTILPGGAVLAGAQWQVDGGVLQPSGVTVLGLSVGTHAVSFTAAPGFETPSNQVVSVTANATNSASGTYTELAAPASDFTYVTNAGTIIITGYVGPGGSVLMPSTINGFPVGTIASDAFSGDTTLTSITIAESVTNIGDFAFSSCTGLEAATLSDGVTNIPFGLFEDCFRLSQVTLGSNVASLADFAFTSCSSLNSVTLADGLTNLGYEAFDATALTNVTIPASLTTIGQGAFLQCFQLHAINVSPANPAFSSAGGVLYNKNQTEMVTYPDGMTGTSYIIANTVTSIGASAFQFCSLATVSIPDSVTNIGASAFESCADLSVVVLPPNLQSIGDTAFGLCPNLTSITIPASVSTLGAIAFTGCQNMSAITVAAGNPNYSSLGGVLYNQAGTVLIEFPGGPTGTFAVPPGVQDIGSQAFAACQLTGLSLPSTVTNIDPYGIFNCSFLNSVTLCDGLLNMGIAAFEDCYQLTNIVLPATLTNMGDYAFAFSGNMVGAYFEGNAPPDDSTVFVGENQMTVYYLPGTTGWGSTFGGAPTMPLPGISVSANPTHGPAPLPVAFTAAAVNDSNNPVLNWQWTFGDGAISSARAPLHTYTNLGSFIAALVETNNAGLPISGQALEIVVTQAPLVLGSLAVSGPNLVLDASGGLSGHTVIVLASTNLALSLPQWTPMATNTLAANGNFSLTLTNAVNTKLPATYYVLLAQ